MKKLLMLLLAATMVVSFSQCSKTGPEGPQGEQGAAGTEGPRGANGSKGDKGDKGTTGATGTKGDKGDKGATGTTGPRGATGAAGPRGATGAKGDKGDPGTANVVVSGWIDYTINSTPNTSTYKTMKYTFPANVLNLINADHIADFLSDGGLLVLYGRNFGNGQHNMLPYTYSNVEYTWSGGAIGSTVNAILIRIRSTDGTALTEYDYSAARGNEFRYVLVPAGVQVSGRLSSSPPDYKDYHAVCEYYGIPE